MCSSKSEAAGEYIRLWRPPNTTGVELYSARLFFHSYGKHFHDQYTIGINDAGLGSFWCRGANQQAVPRSVNLLGPGEVHTGAATTDKGWTYRNVYLAPALVEAVARQLEWRSSATPSFSLSVARDDCVWGAADRLFWALHSPQSRLETDTAMLETLRLLFERFGDCRPAKDRCSDNDHAVERARRYLKEHYRDAVSLEELAVAARVSSFYLVRCFRRHVGLPPHAYQLQLRLQSAKAELKSDASLAEIALKHGFFDQSHFHRHFKRTFGVSPGRYRQGNFVQDN